MPIPTWLPWAPKKELTPSRTSGSYSELMWNFGQVMAPPVSVSPLYNKDMEKGEGNALEQ